MQVTNVTFDNPFTSPNPPWLLRLKVEGSDFVQRAAPIVAEVGSVPVEAVVVYEAGAGFMGLLATLPADGDELKVGYLDTGLNGTGFIYHPTGFAGPVV